MRINKQISNPRQQPSRRHYYRDRDEYDRDELHDVFEGGDYTYGAPAGMPNDYGHRDYTRFNSYSRPFYEVPRRGDAYVPSRDYGYERDPMNPAHYSYRHGEAVGYGNEFSKQGRDFENWLHHDDRYRNAQANYADDEFSNEVRHPLNRDDDRYYDEERPRTRTERNQFRRK